MLLFRLQLFPHESSKPGLKDTSQTPLCHPVCFRLGHGHLGHLHCYCQTTFDIKRTALFCFVAWVSACHSFRLGSSDSAGPSMKLSHQLSLLWGLHHLHPSQVIQQQLACQSVCFPTRGLFENEDTFLNFCISNTKPETLFLTFVKSRITLRSSPGKHTYAQNFPCDFRRIQRLPEAPSCSQIPLLATPAACFMNEHLNKWTCEQQLLKYTFITIIIKVSI